MAPHAAVAARPGPQIRASLACHSCRRRKVKCDVQNLRAGQQCTPCQQTNINCAVDSSADRRKSGSRKHIETLEKRIHSLEALLRRSASYEQGDDESQTRMGSAAPDPDAAQDTRHCANILAAGDPHMIIDEDEDTINVQQSSPAACSPTSQPAQPAIEEDSSTQSEPLLSLQQAPSDAIAGGSIAVRHRDVSSDGNQEDRPSPNRARMNSASRHGSFGPTSPLHLLSSSDHPPTVIQDDLASTLGIAIDIDSPRVRDGILQSYFKYQTLWTSVVDQEVFLDHRTRGRSFWYSSFLETVLLASAARLSTSEAIRSLSHKYAARAREGILPALETPSAASLQGFLLLSEFEVTQGRDRVGWMFCGMACRMITDLGLCGPGVSVEQTDMESTPSESILLHRLLCACISYEGIWCIYLGRPSSIPRSVLDIAIIRCSNDRGQEAAMLAAWVGLCIPMSEICEVLNCTGSLDSKAASRLSELDTELRKWQNSLPPSIAYNEHRLLDLDPVAFGMHMQCCKVQILMYCAIKEAVGAGNCMSTLAHCQGQETPQQIIHDKALQIIRLLLTYRQIHGVEKVPSIMLDSANLALTSIISHCLDPHTPGASNERDMQWLRLSVDTMRAVQSHFPITQRMLHTLEKMVDGSPLAGLFATAASSESPRRHLSGYHAEIMSPGNIEDMHGSFGTNNMWLDNISMGTMDRFARGERILSQQPPALDCGWLPHDPGEVSAALLSFPDFQLASLLLPATTGIAEG